MLLEYSTDAERDLRKLPKQTARRIKKKMDFFMRQEDPLEFSEPLTGRHGVYRFRIGDYRVIFTVEKGAIVILLVLAIKHRGEAYR